MIKISNVNKTYGKHTILKDVSMEIKPGEIVALVGKNGCGKSTLIQILCGILKPDTAEISYWDKNPLENKKLFKEYIGYVPQDTPLLEELSVKDNLKFWAAGASEVDSGVIAQFELSEILNKKTKDLSGGMKRRLAIACTLQRKNKCIVLDEPTSALDIYYQNGIVEWMKAYSDDGGIIIMSTHNESEIAVADVVYILNEGEITRFNKGEFNMDDIRAKILISDK